MEHLSHKRKLTIMAAIIMAMFFSAINQTIVSTAMPRIIAELNGMEYYSWVITIYMLTSTLATVLVGKLSDIYGRKPFLLIGIVIFMIGAFLTGFSRDIIELIIYRGVQGLGAGIIMSTVFTAVGDLFSPRERGKWTGVMMGVFGFSSILGPALGGWLVDNFAWKWLFWVFLPLGFVAFFMILTLFPKVERKPKERIDYEGSFFLSIVIITLLLDSHGLARSTSGVHLKSLDCLLQRLYQQLFLCLWKERLKIQFFHFHYSKMISYLSRMQLDF